MPPFSVRKNRSYPGTRQTLIHRKCSDGKVAKAIEAAPGCYPDIAFAILKKYVSRLRLRGRLKAQIHLFFPGVHGQSPR